MGTNAEMLVTSGVRGIVDLRASEGLDCGGTPPHTMYSDRTQANPAEKAHNLIEMLGQSC